MAFATSNTGSESACIESGTKMKRKITLTRVIKQKMTLPNRQIATAVVGVESPQSGSRVDPHPSVLVLYLPLPPLLLFKQIVDLQLRLSLHLRTRPPIMKTTTFRKSFQ